MKMDKGSWKGELFKSVVNNTYYVALALPWTLTVIRGIQVPRYSNAAWVVRFPLIPPVPGPPCATPWAPEPEPPRQKVGVCWGRSE